MLNELFWDAYFLILLILALGTVYILMHEIFCREKHVLIKAIPFVVVAIISFVSIDYYISQINTARKLEFSSKVNSGYVVYIDGEEADGWKVDVELYRYTIDNEAKEIYMTRK